MHFLKKTCGLILVLSMINLTVSTAAFSQQNWYAKADITKNDPVITAPPEQKIPVETVEKKGGKAWLWVLLAVVVVGGGAAAAASAGGEEDSGGGSSGTTTTTNGGGTGDVTVSW